MNHLVVTSNPDDELTARWNAFLEKTRLATHYVTPNYFLDPFVRGDRFAVLAVDQSSEIAAVLTGVRFAGRVVSGTFSRPQVIVRTRTNRGKAVSALASGLRELAGNSTLTEIYTLEPLEFNCHGMRARRSGEDTPVVMLDLANDIDAILADSPPALRSGIQGAKQKRRVEIREPETDAELKQLYQIYCEQSQKKGTPPFTFENMQTAVAHRVNRRMFLAKFEGRTIAGGLYSFCPGGVVECTAVFSLAEYGAIPRDLLDRHAIRWARENGFTHFRLGEAQHALRSLGGEVMTTYRYRRDPSPFRLHDLHENAVDLGIGALHRLPETLITRVRRIFAI